MPEEDKIPKQKPAEQKKEETKPKKRKEPIEFLSREDESAQKNSVFW